MDTQLKKKYGLFTAISMVVGIVIGSGVFFKAEKILNVTGGNLPLGILAWIIGGVIKMICSLCLKKHMVFLTLKGEWQSRFRRSRFLLPCGLRRL